MRLYVYSQVMERLMTISADYWTNFINIDGDRTMYPVDSYTPNTPEARPGKGLYDCIVQYIKRK